MRARKLPILFLPFLFDAPFALWGIVVMSRRIQPQSLGEILLDDVSALSASGLGSEPAFL